jgi:hypothetical protein
MDEKKITFALLGIQNLKFLQLNPFDVIPGFNLDNVQFETGLNLNYKWNIEQNRFAVVIHNFYKHKNGSEDITLFELKEIMDYNVKNLSDLFTVRSPSDFDIDLNLEVTLVGIAISTFRGILHEKTKGTIYNQYILPVVNPMDFILSKKLKKTL